MLLHKKKPANMSFCINSKEVAQSNMRLISPFVIKVKKLQDFIFQCNNHKYVLNRGKLNPLDLTTIVDVRGGAISRGTIAIVINIPRKRPSNTLDCKIDISD